MPRASLSPRNTTHILAEIPHASYLTFVMLCSTFLGQPVAGIPYSQPETLRT